MPILFETDYAVFSLTAMDGVLYATKVRDVRGYEDSLMGESKFENGVMFRGTKCELEFGKPMHLGNPDRGGIVTSVVINIWEEPAIPTGPDPTNG